MGLDGVLLLSSSTVVFSMEASCYETPIRPLDEVIIVVIFSSSLDLIHDHMAESSFQVIR